MLQQFLRRTTPHPYPLPERAEGVSLSLSSNEGGKGVSLSLSANDGGKGVPLSLSPKGARECLSASPRSGRGRRVAAGEGSSKQSAHRVIRHFHAGSI